eukprot:504094_1
METMTPYLSQIITIIITFIFCCYTDDTIIELEINTDATITQKYPELSMSQKFEVQFENKSGYDCILYWVNLGTGDYVEQAEMLFPSLTNIGTYPGHTFVYALKSDPSVILHSFTMSPYITIVTLLPKDRMDTINKNDKLQFYKNYYLKTGQYWQNYYPRNPLIYSYLNTTHIGQIITAKSNHTKYYKITANSGKQTSLISNNNTLSEQLKTHKAHTIAHGDLKLSEIDHHEFEVKDHYIVTYNHSEFYRNKIDENNYKLNVLCTRPQVIQIFDFLSDDECEHLISIGMHSPMMRSTVGETKLTNTHRTSSHIWVIRDLSTIVDNVINRIGDMVGIDGDVLHSNKSSEDLQLVHYNEGEYYHEHHDYGTDQENNRYITVLMYLNDVKYGGNTSFPIASDECKDHNGYFGVKPIKNSAVVFYDMLMDANVDPLSKHEAEPPVNGSDKWMTNLWIWDPYFHHTFSGYDT